MAQVPAATVTFLYADIEGSTRLVQTLGSEYPTLLEEYRRLVGAAIALRQGRELSSQGDAYFAGFARVGDAVAAAVAAQRAFRDCTWPRGITLRVRMGIHTGEPSSVGSEYVGIDVHRAARVGAAGYGGQILLSESARVLAQDHLPAGASVRDLGKYHLKDLAGSQRLFQITVSDLPSDFPPLKAPDRLPNNLPVELSSFIGREREIAELKRHLLHTRLLTLTGPGGVGKTRLALQIAAEALRDFSDGAWLVELATCFDPDLVPQIAASALDVTEQAGTPIVGTLTDYLKDKHMLLILDNCEHLLMEAARLTDALLRKCPDIKVLATSREALRINGELAWHVPALALPDFRRLPALHDLIKFEGVRLFVERATSVHPAFAATEQNAPEILRVCRQLDGIPLALELAAARVKGLPVELIAAKLDDRFRLLTKGSRTALPQHQTLQAVMDWSYNLLADLERTVFRRASVFSGGFSLEAAEAICAGHGIDRTEILDLMTLLVDKSLVTVEEREHRSRYSLLDTVRQYARQKLRAATEEAGVRDRHSAWYLALAEATEPELFGTAQSTQYASLEIEHDNFREALDWYCEGQTANAGLRLAGALYWFWQVRGHLREGSAWLEKLLARRTATSAPVRAKALYAAAALANAQRDYEKARILSEAGLVQFQRLRDSQGIARCRFLLGFVGLELGNYSEATGHLRASLTLSEESGDKRGIGISLNMLGEVARSQGQYESAAALYNQALPMRRELGDERGLAISLHNLAYVAMHQHDNERAVTLFKESLAIRQRLGHKQGIAYCLAGFAAIATERRQYTRAAKLWGAAEQFLGEIGAHMDRSDRLEFDRSLDVVRSALAPEQLAAAWQEGCHLDFEQAVEYALGT